MENEIIEVQTKEIIPQKDFDIDGFIEKRKEFIEKVNKIMVEGKDYHLIQGRKSMAKGGAEKIASIFGWTADFKKDTEAMEAFAELKGVISFVCDLYKEGANVGQGRGAALLGKNANDPNKTIKMAQKSAFIDAVIRASGLSDFYTQDLEDMAPESIQGQNASPQQPQQATGTIKPSQAQYNLITKLMGEKRYSKEDLITQGFVPGTLTGGKEGTASQMIDFLLKAPVNNVAQENPDKSQNQPVANENSNNRFQFNREVNVEDIPY